LAAGCDVHVQDNNESTALMWASGGGYSTIIDRLAAHGANVNLQDQCGESALIKASREGRIEAVDRLLSLNCDPNSQDAEGWTALMRACCERKTDVVKLLLDHGADPLISNNEGKKATDFAWLPEIEILFRGLIFSPLCLPFLTPQTQTINNDSNLTFHHHLLQIFSPRGIETFSPLCSPHSLFSSICLSMKLIHNLSIDKRDHR